MRRPLTAATAAAALLLAACSAAPDEEGVGSAPPVEESAPDPEVPDDVVDGDELTPKEDADREPAPDPPVEELPEPPDAAAAFELSEQEVYPNAKRLAAAIAQGVTTYDPDQQFVEALTDLGLGDDAARLGREANALHHPGSWSRGRVLYPQLGGVTDDDISVMVVTEQLIGAPEGVRTEVRTLDVRLRLVDDVWTFDELADPGGEAPEQPAPLPAAARAVLEHDRIDLPDSARWDILSGHTDLTLLEVMARAADQWSFGVVTLMSGHPHRVFGTDRLSDHTRGQAVDIHLVDEVEVIDDRTEGSPTYEFVEWLYEQPEVKQIGSPWALDGFGGRSFTDIVHQDHVHVAIEPVPWGQAGATSRRPAS